MAKPNLPLKPLLCIFGVEFLYGFDFIAMEFATKYIPPEFFTFLRLMVGVCFLVPLCFIVNKGIKIDKKDWPRLLLCGILGLGLYQYFLGLGTSLTSGSFGSLIMATVPIFGIVGDRIFYKSKITWLKILCALTSGFGVYLLIAGSPLGVNMLGVLVLVLGSSMAVVYIVGLKPLDSKYDALTILTVVTIIAAIFTLLLALATNDLSTIKFTPKVVGVTVASALITVTLPELGYVYSICKLPVTITSAFENVLPLTTVIFSFVIFGTLISPVQMIGGGLVMAAVMVLALKSK